MKTTLRGPRQLRLRKHVTARPTSRRLLVEPLENRSLLAALQGALPFVPGEILIGLKGDLPVLFHKEGPAKAIQTAAARLEHFGLSRGEILLDHRVGGPGDERLITRWKLPAENDLAAVASALSKFPGVAYAEPNYVWSTAATIPNDPRFGELWGMDNTGQSGGTPDADIDAPEAWDISTGSSSVIVGVIDTGVDYNHPDLAANIWNNPGECLGLDGSCALDGIDNDGNGYTDDFHGINAITGSGDPLDDNNHGTHVSGTIGAKGNNGIGVAGVNWNVRIAACKFLDANGSGSTANAIECFQYFNALKTSGQNIVVTNNSWGGGGFSQALSDAMAGPGPSPILHAVAAGNSNSNNDATPSYPSSYDLPNIISVAATDRFDKYASFSSYGLTSVDLAAPGVSILSTTRNNTYSTFSGTSMATPHVAGAAALISAVYPTFTAAQLKEALMDGTDVIGGIGTNSSKPTVTDGRLNVNQTLINLGETDTIAPAAVTNLAVSATGLSSVTLTWTATGDDVTEDGISTGTARSYDVRYSTSPISDANWATATKAVGEPRPQAAGSTETFRVKGLQSGTTYYFALKVQDNKGNDSGLSNVASTTTVLGTIIFSDGFESGLSQWTAQSPWGRTTANKHSGDYSVTDSPSGSYANNTNTSLTSATIDLSAFKETQLSFWHRYDLEQGYDYGRFEISTNGGVNWATLASYTGTSTTFQKVTVDLSAYDGRSSVMVRFRLQSDYSIRADGWYVDDVEIVGVKGPGISVAPTFGLVTTEAGGAATFTVVLVNEQPTAPVTIILWSNKTTEGTVSPASLTFTPADWSAAQTVTVTGVDDTLTDGDVVYSIVTDAATSDDLRYNGINPPNVSVTNRDNDTKFYVVNDGSPDRTYEYAATGTAVENYAIDSGNTAPRGAASTAAGDKVWVVDANKKVYVYGTSGGLLGSWTAGSLASNATVEGIATDGTDIWIVDARSDKVFKYTNAAGTLPVNQNAASSFALNSGNRNPKDIVTDGTYLWVVNDASTDTVFKYTVSGTLIGSWTITSGGGSPTGITLDPASVSNIWIVDNNTDRVYQFNAAASRTSGSQSPSTSFALSAGNTNPQGIADPPAPSVGGLTTPLNSSSTRPPFDNDDVALRAIQAEWNSSHRYTDRVKNLSGNNTSPTFASRSNGDYFLIGDDDATQTVFDTGVVDRLTGNQGVDLFFADLDSFATDDLGSTELAVDIDF